MTDNEIQLAKDVRRTFERHPIDTSSMEILVIKNRVYLGGTISYEHSKPNVDVKKEIDRAEHILYCDPRIKEVVKECHIISQVHRDQAHIQTGYNHAGSVAGRR